MQVEDGNFGATVDANKRAYHADATVGILDHSADLITPTRIPATKVGQKQRTNQRRNNLSPMCMPGELEREASGCSTFVGEVWLVSQQNRGAIGGQPGKEQIEPVASCDDVIYAGDMQLRARAAKRAEVVGELACAAGRQYIADRLCARPVVMIAQHCHHPIVGLQAAQSAG